MSKMLYMGISGSLLIAAIICFRHFFFHLMPKRFFVFLWICAIARLLLPVSVPVRRPAVIWQDKAAASGSGQAARNVCSFARSAAEYRGCGALNKRKSVPAAGKAETAEKLSEYWKFSQFRKHLQRLQNLFLAVWLTVAVSLAAGIVRKHRKSLQIYKMSLPVCEERAEKWLQTHRRFRKVGLRESEFIKSPMTYGMIRPVILLPSGITLNEEEFLCIMEHEWIHIQRMDIFVKYLLYLTLCIYWFDPLVWIMAVLLNRDMETACDEAVINKYSDSIKKTYVLLFIRLAEGRSASVWPVNAGFARYSKMKERIQVIMKTKRYSGKDARKAIVLAIGMLCCTAAAFTVPSAEAAKATALEEAAETSAAGAVAKKEADAATGKGTTGTASKTAAETGTVSKTAAEYAVLEEGALQSAGICQNETDAGRERSEQVKKQIVELAKNYVGAPYQSGGTDLKNGVDSAGFVKAVYAKAGIGLPEDLFAWAAERSGISPEQLCEGDIIFYYAADGSGTLSHAAIYDGAGQVIHASNMREGVKVSDLHYREIGMAVRVWY